MINVGQRKNQNDITHSGPQEANHEIREIGQSRRAKMHASCLMENLNNKNLLTPALRELLEASLILQTTDAKVLAAHLHRSPAIIRADFQRILTILGDNDRHSASRTTKDEDFLCSQVSN